MCKVAYLIRLRDRQCDVISLWSELQWGGQGQVSDGMCMQSLGRVYNQVVRGEGIYSSRSRCSGRSRGNSVVLPLFNSISVRDSEHLVPLSSQLINHKMRYNITIIYNIRYYYK